MRNLCFLFSALLSSCSTEPKTAGEVTIPTFKNVQLMAPLTLEELAAEMKVTAPQLQENTKLLIDYLSRSQTREKICDEEIESREDLCELIEDLEEVHEERIKKAKYRPPKLTPKNLSENQSLTYSQANSAIYRSRREAVLSWTDKLIEHQECPRNLSGAALRKIEESLPKPEAYEAMEKLYAHASPCFKPTDAGYETIHFRQGLIRFLNKNTDGARTSIELALKTEKPEEKGRSLYWKGLLTEDADDREEVWKELTDTQPMTYHSLLVWKSKSLDPLKAVGIRPEAVLKRVTPELSSSLARVFRFIEAFYLTKQPRAAERLTKWLTTHEELPIESIVYLGALKNSHAQHHNAIRFLTEQIVQNPKILSAQVLKLLYPAPYFDVFEKYSNGVDTFLVMGLARQESAFNPNARSPARAEGVMQILPRVARIKMQTRKRVDLFDMDTNVKVGSRLLKDWIGQFGAVEYALIAYNAGPLRVPEWKQRYPTDNMALFLDLIPFKETRNYVGSILRNNYWYHRLYENDPSFRPNGTVENASTLYSHIVKSMLDRTPAVDPPVEPKEN